jgi:hypothetical protein
MFAPPIWRRRWRDNAFRPVRSDEDGGNPANIAASEASKLDRARCASSSKKRVVCWLARTGLRSVVAAHVLGEAIHG